MKQKKKKEEPSLSDIFERLELLKQMLRSNSDFLMNLAERIGHNFAKQVFTIGELSIRWACSESHVRNLIHSYNMRLLRTKGNQIVKPYKVMRKSVLEFENGSLGLYKEKYKRPRKIVTAR